MEIKNNNYNFAEFDEVIYSYFYLSNDIVIPLRVDISNISITEYNEIFFKGEKTERELIIDNNDSPFKQEYEYLIFKRGLKDFLKHLDLESKLFDNNKHTLLEHLELKTLDDLIEHMLKVWEVDIQTLMNLKIEISNYASMLMENFIYKLKEYLELNPNPREFKPDMKGINPKDYDTSFSQTYIKLQSMIEYHNSTPLFKENYGKAYSEYSWREIQTRLMFLNRKNQVDTEQNRMQDDIYKKMDNDTKKGAK
jgi:hypothetical protein